MSGELILVVEDDEHSRKLLRDVLQVTGYRTIESNNAEDGLHLAGSCAPALILMDVQLPGMSGIDALCLLRAQRQTKDIPVIAVTASVMQAQQGMIARAGFDGFEAKPISVTVLLAKIRALLDSSASRIQQS